MRRSHKQNRRKRKKDGSEQISQGPDEDLKYSMQIELYLRGGIEVKEQVEQKISGSVGTPLDDDNDETRSLCNLNIFGKAGKGRRCRIRSLPCALLVGACSPLRDPQTKHNHVFMSSVCYLDYGKLLLKHTFGGLMVKCACSKIIRFLDAKVSRRDVYVWRWTTRE